MDGFPVWQDIWQNDIGFLYMYIFIIDMPLWLEFFISELEGQFLLGIKISCIKW